MSATELYTITCTFKRFIDYVDIAGRSSARGVKQGTRGANKLFSSKIRQYLENGPNYYYALSMAPRSMTLDDLGLQ